jgi:hypothetical protein
MAGLLKYLDIILKYFVRDGGIFAFQELFIMTNYLDAFTVQAADLWSEFENIKAAYAFGATNAECAIEALCKDQFIRRAVFTAQMGSEVVAFLQQLPPYRQMTALRSENALSALLWKHNLNSTLADYGPEIIDLIDAWPNEIKGDFLRDEKIQREIAVRGFGAWLDKTLKVSEIQLHMLSTPRQGPAPYRERRGEAEKGALVSSHDMQQMQMQQ